MSLMVIFLAILLFHLITLAKDIS